MVDGLQDFSVQNGYSTIDGEGERRGIDIDSEYGYPTNINFERIEVRDCDDSGIRNHGILTMTDSIVQSNYGLLGGGINNSNMLSLKNSTVSGNSSKYSGGGIHNSGTLELMNSTVKDNQTEGDGGGIETSVFELYITNSTISNNSAGDFGGGLFYAFAKAYRKININNSTISGNSADQGGGFYSEESPYRWRTTFDQEMQNTILAGNTDKKGSPDCFGAFFSGGYNLIGNVTGCKIYGGSGDRTNIDAGLLPLEGSPSYHPLYRFSPAIDAGNPAGCKDYDGKLLETDQRGVKRKGRCDIGVYEYDADRFLAIPVIFRAE